MSETHDLIDLSGLQCPLPVLRTQKLLRDRASGTEITVLVTDPASTIDMPHFCREAGHELLESEKSEKGFIYRIRKG